MFLVGFFWKLRMFALLIVFYHAFSPLHSSLASLLPHHPESVSLVR
jgi:hypothetical protein